MDELPISIVSNDLKYALSSLKIKTFQRAREYYYQQQNAYETGNTKNNQPVGVGDKLFKIKKYLQKYNSARHDVWQKINSASQDDDSQIHFITLQRDFKPKPFNFTESDEEQEKSNEPLQTLKEIKYEKQPQQEKTQNNRNSSKQHEEMNLRFNFSLEKIQHDSFLKIEEVSESPKFNKSQHQKILANKKMPKNLFEKYFLCESTIIEIFGSKGVGKTALLLYLCERYAQISKAKIYFINCVGGVTAKRFQRLQGACSNLEYRDSYILDHVLGVCRTALESQQPVGCIAVDSLPNLLLEEEKTLIFLIKLFQLFSELIARRGCTILLSNYPQQIYEHNEDDELTNHYTYYSSVTSEFVQFKYYLKKCPKTPKVLLKMVKGGFANGEFFIGSDGVKEFKLAKQSNLKDFFQKKSSTESLNQSF